MARHGIEVVLAHVHTYTYICSSFIFCAMVFDLSCIFPGGSCVSMSISMQVVVCDAGFTRCVNGSILKTWIVVRGCVPGRVCIGAWG